MTDDRFIDYQDKIYQVAIFLINPRLALLKQLNDGENKVLWSIAAFHGIFTVFYQSVFDSLIVTLSWLFSQKADRGLIWYLNQVKVHSKVFSKDEIDAQLKQIQDAEETIKKILIIRDKWIAHRDAAPFNNPDKFLEENEITIEDLEKLVNLAERIIQEHFGKFQDTFVEFELPSTNLDDLTRCMIQRNGFLNFLEKYDIGKRNPDYLERVSQARKKLFDDTGL
jgi:hypothetical protein